MKSLISVVFVLVLTTNVFGLEVMIGEGGQPFADPFCGS